MKRTILLLALTISVTSIGAAQNLLVSAEFLSNTPSVVLSIVPGIDAQYDVDYYKITYKTVDAQGDSTVATGALAVPVSSSCNVFPLSVYCHGTVLKKLDVPSFDNFEGTLAKAFASTGFISVAPDYIGLGDSPGLHPYLHGESEATATVDLIRASREYLQQISMADNGQVFITGYSQGGHAAMATLKYIQQNNLDDEIDIAGGAPCSGPYNLAGTQTDILLSGEPYSNPGYVVYLIKSYELAYGNLYDDISAYLKSPYDDDMDPYFDGEQNIYSMGDVNSELPDVLSEFMEDSVFSGLENDPNHPLRVALEDNNNYDWAPEFPMRMYYCTGDEQVNYQNALDAEAAMTDNGATDVEAINVGDGLSHGDCYTPALTAAHNFFESMAEPCEFSSLQSTSAMPKLRISPSPSSGMLNIQLPQSGGRIMVVDMSGRVVARGSTGAKRLQWNLGQLAGGIYQVIYIHGGNRRAGRWVKQ